MEVQGPIEETFCTHRGAVEVITNWYGRASGKNIDLIECNRKENARAIDMM